MLQLLNEKWRTFIRFKYECVAQSTVGSICRFRFFQRMAIFTFYFGICLFALLLRGYYRVPPSCLIQEVLDKEENTVKSIIADRMECNCHYTNFLWQQPFFDFSNRTTTNSSEAAGDGDEERSYLEPLVGSLSPCAYANRPDRFLLQVLNILDALSIFGALMYILSYST